MIVRYDDVAVGDELPSLSTRLQRVNLIMYCGAGGDFNPIHWNERVATSVGLPNVIAHGMLTMATAGRVVTDWLGDPGALESYSVRFSSPVVVPDDERGTTIVIGATVADKLGDGRIRIDLTATVDGVDVLRHATCVVRLA